MGWPVTPANSYPFVFRGEQYAIGCFPDPDVFGWDIGVFRSVGGQWMNLGGPQSGFLRAQISSADIVAAGTTRDYLLSVLVDAEALIRQKLVPPKPDQNDKCECLAYDLAVGDVAFDPQSLTFAVAPPPLSHAR